MNEELKKLVPKSKQEDSSIYFKLNKNHKNLYSLHINIQVVVKWT